MSHSPVLEPVTKKEKLVRQSSSGLQKFMTTDQIRQPSEHKNSYAEKGKIRLGVCAMEKKTSCKPMQEILDRLSATGDIHVIVFPEPLILNAPVQEWPIVDCLITFHSTGFPLSKAEQYVELRKPYMVNELKFQESLLWRHKMYEILVQHGIPVPKHYVVIDEKIAKKTKKSHTVSGPPDNLDQLPQINLLEEKLMSRDLDKDDKTSQTSSQRSSFWDKDARPTLSLIQSIDGTPLLDKEEEKADSGKEKEPTSQTLSRQHSQSSIQKANACETKPEGHTHRRKYSEHLIIPKFSKAESISGDESPQTETATAPSVNRTPLSNYHKKYYTKIEEHDDFVMIGDHKLAKPFVEKPLDADDHQINIYYSKSDGGGCKSLFRKTNNISSSFDANANQIRRGGSYVYEVFLPTEGFDIKVYTVGPNYAHAEARKSPVLDGIVQRTKDGKEVRYPVNLTYEEKIIAKKIVFAFDQQICGFDLLRSKGKSYVCDVNGWSFVKGNAKYYTDCAMLLRAMMLARFAPERLTPLHPMLSQLNNNRKALEVEKVFRPSESENSLHFKEELRSVVCIFRHGDRTPKQKMKMITKDSRYLNLFDEQEDKHREIKLKTVKQLQKILDITQEIIDNFYSSNFTRNSEYTAEVVSKHLQLFSVLKRGGHFEGINRKIQLKPLQWDKIVDPVTNETKEVVTEGLFILKWGGELTHSGIQQAEELGASFRNQVYPQENEGILRLHATYRHDLKIYASQEGRCQNTAAAFCKGLLELEGDLTPILVSLVRKDESTQDLLEFNKTQECNIMADVKVKLWDLMNSDNDLYEEVRKVVKEEDLDVNIIEVLKDVGKPLTLLKRTFELVKKLAWNIKKSIATNEDTYYLSLNDMGFSPKLKEAAKPEKSPSVTENLCEEVPILIFKRWKKLENDFYKPKQGIFDISKVPDIYYSIRYDMLHSKTMVEANKEICEELFDCSQRLASFVIPAEYGLTVKERAASSLTIISNLVKKVTHDLIWWNSPFIKQAEQIVKDEQSFLEHKGLDPSKVGEDVKSIWRHVRTRLYFTSASHLYSLYNVIALGLKMFSPKSENFRALLGFTSLDYLSHMMIRLYENLNAKHEDPNRFRLEIMFSQGCNMEKKTQFNNNDGHRVAVAPSVVLNSQLTLDEVEKFLNGLLKLAENHNHVNGANGASQPEKKAQE